MQARIKPTQKHEAVFLPGLTIVGRQWTEIPAIAETAAKEHPYLQTRKSPEAKADKKGGQ